MEPNQKDLPIPDEIDDTTYYFIRHHNDQAVGLRRRGDLDEAIANCNKVLTVSGDIAVVYNNRGIAWLQKGDVDRALSDFSRAIEIASEFGEIRWLQFLIVGLVVILLFALFAPLGHRGVATRLWTR